jgi:hypothetical protein
LNIFRKGEYRQDLPAFLKTMFPEQPEKEAFFAAVSYEIFSHLFVYCKDMDAFALRAELFSAAAIQGVLRSRDFHCLKDLLGFQLAQEYLKQDDESCHVLRVCKFVFLQRFDETILDDYCSHFNTNHITDKIKEDWRTAMKTHRGRFSPQ